MSRVKRFQIPVDEVEITLLQRASKQAGKSAAEWARTLLLQCAKTALQQPQGESPAQLIKRLRSLQAPVADIDQMNREIFKKRYV